MYLSYIVSGEHIRCPRQGGGCQTDTGMWERIGSVSRETTESVTWHLPSYTTGVSIGQGGMLIAVTPSSASDKGWAWGLKAFCGFSLILTLLTDHYTFAAHVKLITCLLTADKMMQCKVFCAVVYSLTGDLHMTYRIDCMYHSGSK